VLLWLKSTTMKGEQQSVSFCRRKSTLIKINNTFTKFFLILCVLMYCRHFGIVESIMCTPMINVLLRVRVMPIWLTSEMIRHAKHVLGIHQICSLLVRQQWPDGDGVIVCLCSPLGYAHDGWTRRRIKKLNRIIFSSVGIISQLWMLPATCHPPQVNGPRLNPIQLRKQVHDLAYNTYPGGKEDWVDLDGWLDGLPVRRQPAIQLVPT